MCFIVIEMAIVIIMVVLLFNDLVLDVVGEGSLPKLHILPNLMALNPFKQVDLLWRDRRPS